jgi:hypothetical protein
MSLPSTSSRLAVVALAAAAATAAAFPRGGTGEPPAWEQVRPLLEARCLPCHGGEEVRGGLRFATAETFRAGGSRGPAYLPEAPQESRILQVISYGDPDLAMPPTGKLADDEIEVLRRWVLAGAPWPEGEAGRLADPERFPDAPDVDFEKALDWWSYAALDDPVLPVVRDAERVADPLDAFVLARLDEAGLELAPQADPETLLRRASFDLTGLPPTVAERARFLADVDARGFEPAWTDLVERLLASPHYGEHWARKWLDLVRYAETNGYERDATKTNAWRYRDWVIRALNADMPYDRFLLEQLAGDEFSDYAPELLAHPGDSGPLLATGWYRLGTWDDEPSDPAQARADELADIVDTAGQVFLGATMGCVRCHDHKADPIRIEEYYGFTAFFSNLEGYGGGGFGQHLGGGRTVELPDPGAPQGLTSLERDRRSAALDRELRPYVLRMHERLAATPAAEVRTLVADARDGAGATWRYVEGPPAQGWQTPGFDDSGWQQGVAGFGTRGTPGARVATEWSGRHLMVRTRFALTEIPDGLVLALHHDEDVVLYLNGVRILERVGYTSDYFEQQLDPRAAQHLVVGSNVLAAEVRQSGGGQYLDIGLRSGWRDAEAHPEAGRQRLRAEAGRWLPAEDVEQVRLLFAERDALAVAPVVDAYPALAAAERGASPAVQRVLLRGSAHAAGDAVEPGVPRAFLAGGGVAPPQLPQPGDEAASSGRRLALARWMTEEGAHLTARVMVNRLWQGHFGAGLCRSPGDFGRLGETPTHPLLLDHLAARLIEDGWSWKAMHRRILDSATWRADSRRDAAARARDPRNLLYAGFPARRLTAEEYRDAALAVGGALDRRLYGPSVYPPLPPEVLATASRPDQAWGRSSAEDAARRSIYVHVKRSLRMPLLAVFDQPDPDLPCPERFPTNVPTQALMTLNGAFTAEQAARLAQRTVAAAETPRERLAQAVLHAYARQASEAELDRGMEFLARLRDEHGLDDARALEVYCLGLLNRNEFLWID